MFNPDFSLTQYMDAEMTDPAGTDDETELGAVLYFKLTMDNPIENVAFVIDGKIIFIVFIYSSTSDCVVKDASLEEDYSVITNQCGDDFLEVTASPVTSDNLQSAINFSYQGFKFVESVDDEAAVNMKLKCSVIVCDANDWYSDCAWGCVADYWRRSNYWG